MTAKPKPETDEVDVEIAVSYRCRRCGVSQGSEHSLKSSDTRVLSALVAEIASRLESEHRDIEGCR